MGERDLRDSYVCMYVCMYVCTWACVRHHSASSIAGDKKCQREYPQANKFLLWLTHLFQIWCLLSHLKESLHHSRKNKHDQGEFWAYPLPFSNIPCIFMLVFIFVVKVSNFALIQNLPFKFYCQRKWWENIANTTTKDILEKEFKQCVFSSYILNLLTHPQLLKGLKCPSRKQRKRGSRSTLPSSQPFEG
jgi:hypothetical protein